jgi:GNAT superfamily N-acetyltransferase
MSATSPSPTPRVRIATLADRNGFVEALLRGYEVDHQFRWRYPRRHEFPQDARKATGDVFEKNLGLENVTCLVAELPSLENEEEWVIVSSCMWEWKDWEAVKGLAGMWLSVNYVVFQKHCGKVRRTKAASDPTGFSPPTSGRRDMDPTRQKIFIDAINEAEKRNFGAEWGPKRLELATMACNAKYHRRGAGKALMEYGLQQAREHNTPITLTASPLGRLMYKNLGFKDLDLVVCGEEGSEEKVSTWVMVWTPEGWTEDDSAT